MTERDSKPAQFKVTDPLIPGVPVVKPRGPGSLSSNTKALPVAIWLTIAIGAVLMLGASFFWWFSLASKRAEPSTTEIPPLAAPPVAAVAPVDRIPQGPGEIFSTADFPAVWASKQFLMQNPVTKERVPATVVRLPGGAYWAFSLIEPFGECRLEYVTDMKHLASYYGLKASHPMVGDPCARAVFDLTNYGSSTDGLVRGQIVQGSALRPPIAIEVRVEGSKIVAVRME